MVKRVGPNLYIDCIVFRTGVLTSFICNRRCVDNVVCIKLSALDPGLIMNRFRGWNLFNHIFQKCGPLLVQSHQKLSPEEFFCKKINPNIFWVCNFEGYLAWFALWSFSIIFNDCIVGSILQSIATVKCSFFWVMFIYNVCIYEGRWSSEWWWMKMLATAERVEGAFCAFQPWKCLWGRWLFWFGFIRPYIWTLVDLYKVKVPWKIVIFNLIFR